MKNVLVFLIIFPFSILSQNNPINFENSGFGSSWTWTVFENDDNPNLLFVNNIDTNGINNSDIVANFTARMNGQPWAGCESLHGFDIGSFELDSTNCIVKIMVYKSKISDVGIKFVDLSNAAQPEKKVSNTLVNQWEELTFDFSDRIGVYPIIKDQIVIFPDFDLNGRTKDEVIYFDNISFSGFIQAESWDCVNDICVSQNNNNGPYSDSLSCTLNCNQTNHLNENVTSKKLIKITDVFGNKASALKKNTPLFYIYDNGMVEKKIIIDF